MMWRMRFTACVLLVMLLSSVVVSAQSVPVQQAPVLPGDAWYPLKLFFERLNLALTSSPAERAIVKLQQASERQREAIALSGKKQVNVVRVRSALLRSEQLSRDAESDLKKVQKALSADQLSRVSKEVSAAPSRLALVSQQLSTIQAGSNAKQVAVSRVAANAVKIAGIQESRGGRVAQVISGQPVSFVNARGGVRNARK